MTYTVEFYSKARGEVLKRTVEAPDRKMAEDGICHYYGVCIFDVRSVEETPAAEPKFRIRRICRIPEVK